MEKGDKTYKDLGYGPYMSRGISDMSNRTFQEIKAALQMGTIDTMSLTTMVLAAGLNNKFTFKVIKQDGTQVFKIDTTNGWVEIGDEIPPTNEDPQVALYLTKNTDAYFAMCNAQNLSSGEGASTDMILLNDSTTEQSYLEGPATTGYVDLGVNSSGWNVPDYGVFDASAAFLDVGDNLYIGTIGTHHNISFYTEGHDSKDRIKVVIRNDGAFVPFKATGAEAPIWVEGGMYYDTSLGKMMIGGPNGWEMIGTTPITSPNKSEAVGVVDSASLQVV